MALSEFARKTGQEYRTLQQIERTLTDAIGKPGAWGKVVPAFEHLRAHMIKLFALEDTEGFLNLVVVDRPDKSREAAQFRGEHHALANRATELLIALRAAASGTDAKAGERACGEVRSLLAELHRHEAGEGAFVQTLFNDEISAHD